MADTMLNQYAPDYLVLPGEVLVEYLQAYGMKRDWGQTLILD